ncbi:hypothetical protein DB347_14465 [Opitutaceae bacterium EW11]|nr:hypothetical protein DB347_14465 [Opitutaceae bacterium EW11]
MIPALLYLQLVSLKNGFLQRARRLRQPRYAIAAVVGLAYFYFFFFRPFTAAAGGGRHPGLPVSAQLNAEMAPVGAFILLAVLVVLWINPSSRAALRFSEAEIAFLFPAPLTRRSLLHYKLIRSQVGIFVSALFLSLLSRRGAMLGGGWWIHALGWWLITSLINLHLLGASFARERLSRLGVRPAVRTAVVLAVFAGVVLLSVRWVGRQLGSLDAANLNGPEDILRLADAVLAAPPLNWLLLPFRAAVAPLFAIDAAQFVGALWITLLILVLHYVWVIHSAVAFEESSVALAEKISARRAALASGQNISLTRQQRRREPFKLLPQGSAVPAFLWKGLIGAGTKYYPLPWLFTTAGLAAASLWLANRPEYRPFARTALTAAVAIAAYAMIVGPVFFRRTAHRTLETMDVFKAYPLRGWQIVLGQLSLPMTMLAAVEITLSAVAAAQLGAGVGPAEVTPANAIVGALGWCLMAAPLGGLLFSINFAMVLLLPAWAGTSAASGQGIEMMGQRLILFAGYLVVLLVALVPAAGIGAIGFVPLFWFTGNLSASIAVGSVLGAAVLAAELAAAIWWLGRRYEHFDLSTESAR